MITSIVLQISGFNPPSTFQAMFEFGKDPDSIVNTINRAAAYYLSALAVAIGFRMNLFNIGVDGQYRLAAMLAAAAGGAWALPARAAPDRDHRRRDRWSAASGRPSRPSSR